MSFASAEIPFAFPFGPMRSASSSFKTRRGETPRFADSRSMNSGISRKRSHAFRA